MSIHKYLLHLSIGLTSTGLFVAAPVGLSWLDQYMALRNATVAPQITSQSSRTNTAVIGDQPRHVTIPSIGIDVSVGDGRYDMTTGHWTLSETAAFYATPTAPINPDNGNTLIYGHNSDEIFGKLPTLQVGAVAVITTEHGYQFTYAYKSTEGFSPTNVSVFNYSGSPRLTLQTCTGAWNQTRQMFYFDLKEYRKL